MPYLRRRRKSAPGFRSSVPRSDSYDEQQRQLSSSSSRKPSRPVVYNRWSRVLLFFNPLTVRSQVGRAASLSKAQKEEDGESDENPSLVSPIVFIRDYPVDGDVSTSDLSADGVSYSGTSLIGKCSVKEDQTIADSKIPGLANCEWQLDRRGRLLARLTAQKSKAYRDMILSREMEARRLSLASHSCGFEEGRTGGHVEADASGTSLFNVAKNHLLFEGHHSLEALWNMSWYSLGHLAVYMGLDETAKLVRVYCQISEETFHAGLLVLAMVIMRLNGYMWQWLGQDSYGLVKFDFHNRRILRDWDASLISILHRDYDAINEFISILAYYLVCISLAHFYNKAWAAYEIWISMVYTRMEVLRKERMEKIGLSFESCDSWQEAICFGDDRCSSLFGSEALLTHTMIFLCLQFSDPGIPVPSIVFHSLLCGLSIAAIRIFGVRLFET